jgi:hypothetical protein
VKRDAVHRAFDEALRICRDIFAKNPNIRQRSGLTYILSADLLVIRMGGIDENARDARLQSQLMRRKRLVPANGMLSGGLLATKRDP